jgi:arylsulfatase A-like enzyme
LLSDLANQGIVPSARQLHALTRWGAGSEPDHDLGRASLSLSPGNRKALAVKMALYDAAIAHVDAMVGRMRNQLARWDLTDNTVVSVFADHGEEFLDHQAEAHRWDHDPRAIRAIGHGHTQFQELLHVPWLACGPGIPAGVRVEPPVSLCDVAPTLLDWLGLETLSTVSQVDVELRGRSQSAMAKAGVVARPARSPEPTQAPAARTTQREDDRPLVAEDTAYGPDLVALRRGKWKLVAKRQGESLGLYNLAVDPGEQQDLRLHNRQKLAELEQDLARWRQAAAGADGRGEGQQGWDDVSETVKKRLKELGYTD